MIGRVRSRKILICSPSHSVRGGVESIIDDLCRELPGYGWQVVLGLGEGSRFNRVAEYRAAYPHLPITAIDGTKGTRSARQAALAKACKELKPDVVLSFRLFDAYEAVASLKQRRGGGPRLAVAIRGYEPHYFFDARLYKGLIDLCVVDGTLLAAACVEWAGLEPAKVVSIPGGVRRPRRRVLPRARCGTLRIGYVGRLPQSDKRILDLVPLIRHLDASALPYRLRVAGEGAEGAALREGLRPQIAEGKVVFEGWKSREELYETVYPQLDCVVNFSAAEGVTITGREAMAHGVVPVISQFVGQRAEAQYIHGVNSLTFAVGDIPSAAANMARLVNEPELLAHLSANAAGTQVGKYSYSGSLAAWAEALDRCLERPPSLAPLPRLNPAPDGRLARLGIPANVAQLMRDALRRRHEHNCPGGEWPTGSGLIMDSEHAELMRFAAEYEGGYA